MFLGHISTFLKLESQIRKQRLKILKNSFLKVHLYSNEPLTFSQKTWQSLYPNVHSTAHVLCLDPYLSEI